MLLIILGLAAILFFLDGATTIISPKYFERRQKFFRMTVKAPAHTNAQKYYFINRIIAGLCAVGAGFVVVYSLLEALKAGI